MKKIITLTHILRLALCLTICLSMALHTSLYAPIYDYTTQNYDLIKEYDESKAVKNAFSGGKTLQITNKSTQKIYARIGYEVRVGILANCEYTGFILNPGQTGKVYKDRNCLPKYVAGVFVKQDNSTVNIPNPDTNRRQNDGVLQWDVYDSGIVYQGAKSN
jgi:hypothetical protein